MQQQAVSLPHPPTLNITCILVVEDSSQKRNHGRLRTEAICAMTMRSLFVPLIAVSLSLLATSAAAPNLAIFSDDIASCMKAQPYVEESCQVSSFPGWPYDAKDCSYKTPIGTLYVTVADAPAERVAAWVLNATLTVPFTADLQSAHPGAFLQVQKILAVDVMYQR
jgi:hypothetical protein